MTIFYETKSQSKIKNRFMPHRPLGKTGLSASPIAFGAFKIGRNEKIKYAHHYDLPTDADSERLLKVFRITALTQVFTIESTVAAALDA